MKNWLKRNYKVLVIKLKMQLLNKSLKKLRLKKMIKLKFRKKNNRNKMISKIKSYKIILKKRKCCKNKVIRKMIIKLIKLVKKE